jgi:WD40 repeat protein
MIFILASAQYAQPSQAENQDDIYNKKRARIIRNNLPFFCNFACTLKIDARNIFVSAFSPDSSFIVTADNNGQICIWNSSSGDKRTLTVDPADWEGKACLAFSHDLSRFATGCDDGSIRIFDTNTAQLLQAFYVHENRILNLACNHDGSKIFSNAAGRCWPSLLDVQTATTIDLDKEDNTLRVKFNNTSSRIVTTELFDWNIFDVETGECVQSLKRNKCSTHFAILDDGSVVIPTSAQPWIDIRKCLTTFKENDFIYDAKLSYDKSCLAIASNHTLKIFDTLTGSCLQKFTYKSHCWDVEFSPNGLYLAVKLGRTWSITEPNNQFLLYQNTWGTRSLKECIDHLATHSPETLEDLNLDPTLELFLEEVD